jgi:hypothetical protein
MQPEQLPEPPPPLPDHVPDDLLARYGRDARKSVKQRRSRRARLTRRLRGGSTTPVKRGDSELWETTAVVFFFGVIAVCGLGGLVYAVYLWPTIGMTLVGTLLGLFGLSFFMARRITRRHRGAEPPAD